MRRAAFLAFLIAPVAAACAAAQESVPEAAAPAAVATLTGRAGSGISGSITFHSMAGGAHVEANVQGATPGTHGFHLHERGDCSAEDFSSAGAHFNPTGSEHGAPGTAAHHAGDLGNIEIGADGTGELSVHSTQLAIAEGANAVIGRAVILHEGPDDFVTQPTGNAGGRIACGVVSPTDG